MCDGLRHGVRRRAPHSKEAHSQTVISVHRERRRDAPFPFYHTCRRLLASPGSCQVWCRALLRGACDKLILTNRYWISYLLAFSFSLSGCESSAVTPHVYPAGRESSPEPPRLRRRYRLKGNFVGAATESRSYSCSADHEGLEHRDLKSFVG